MLELPPKIGDALARKPTVGLELGFASTEARSSASTQAFSLQVSPHPAKTREQVVELSKLNLKLTFTADGVHREDLKYESGPVDDAYLGYRGLDVDLLPWSEVVIEQDHCRAGRAYQFSDLVYLSRSDQRAGVDAVQTLGHRGDHVHASGVCESLQFGQGLLDRPLGRTAIDSDHDGTRPGVVALPLRGSYPTAHLRLIALRVSP